MGKKNDKQEFVAHITPRSEDFSQWYTDVILKTDLVDYAPVRGCMVIKPYGYALWERMQAELDKLKADYFTAQKTIVRLETELSERKKEKQE